MLCRPAAIPLLSLGLLAACGESLEVSGDYALAQPASPTAAAQLAPLIAGAGEAKPPSIKMHLAPEGSFSLHLELPGWHSEITGTWTLEGRTLHLLRRVVDGRLLARPEHDRARVQDGTLRLQLGPGAPAFTLVRR